MGEYISQRKQDAIVREMHRQEKKRQKAEKKLKEQIAKGKIKTQDQFFALAEKAYNGGFIKFKKDEISFVDGDQSKKYLVYSCPAKGGHVGRTRLVCCIDQDGQMTFDANYPLSTEQTQEAPTHTSVTLDKIKDENVLSIFGKDGYIYYTNDAQNPQEMYTWQYDRNSNTYTKEKEPTSFEQIALKETDKRHAITSQDGKTVWTYNVDGTEFYEVKINEGEIIHQACPVFKKDKTSIACNTPNKINELRGIMLTEDGVPHLIDPSNSEQNKDKTYMLSNKVCLVGVGKDNYVVEFDGGKVAGITPCKNLEAAIKTASKIDERIQLTESAQLDMEGPEYNPLNLVGIKCPQYPDGATLHDCKNDNCVGGGVAQLQVGSIAEVAERIQANNHEGELSYSKGGPGVDTKSFLGGRMLQ